MAYTIFHSETLKRELVKCDIEILRWVDKVENQLADNPYVGDQLRVPWFREKKKDKFRLYYLIYEELQAVYVVAISDKKDQQRAINTIWLLLDYFQEEIKSLIK